MKIVVIIVRILMGLLFVASAFVVLFNLIPTPQLEGKVKMFNEGLMASGYFMPMLKIIELICGISLLSGRFTTLFTIVLIPITVNIFLFHAFLAPEGLPIAFFLLAGNLFLVYTKREVYHSLLQK
jgi:putative oxidoreductase